MKVFRPEQLWLRRGSRGNSERDSTPEKKGSGSRFVHGGATLQEVIVPVISIERAAKRCGFVESISCEGVEHHHRGSTFVTLYQTQPVR